MSLHNQLHRATRIQSAYQVALGEDHEDFSGIERAGETLTPVIDLWSRPEWAQLRGEDLRSTVESLAAGGAGLFGEKQIFCPLDSRIIFVVTHVWATQPVRMVLEPTLANLSATGDIGIAARDGRSVFSSVVRSRSSNNLAVAITERWRYDAAVFTDQLTWVLPPGVLFRIQQLTANVVIAIGVAGYQRTLMPAEVAP